jgi:hypothetical protein
MRQSLGRVSLPTSPLLFPYNPSILPTGTELNPHCSMLVAVVVEAVKPVGAATVVWTQN